MVKQFQPNLKLSVMCSMDVTGGLQASARMLQDAESGMKQSVAFVQTAASQKLLPAIRSRVANASAKGPQPVEFVFVKWGKHGSISRKPHPPQIIFAVKASFD